MMVWCLGFWFLQSPIDFGFSKAKSFHQERLENLKHDLHENFVFSEKKKIEKYSMWFVGVGLVVSFLIGSWIFAGCIGIGFLFFPFVWIRSVETLRNKKFQKQLLLFIPSLSSMLKSGHGLEKALEQLKNTLQTPMSEELGYMLREVQLGMPLDEALQKLYGRFPSENMQMLTHAIIISRRLGTSLTEAIDNIATNVFQKEKLRQQISSLTSQGKMQAWVAAAMPLFMGAALQIISPSYFRPIFTTTIGHICLAYCFISMAIGLIWIYQITHKELL